MIFWKASHGATNLIIPQQKLKLSTLLAPLSAHLTSRHVPFEISLLIAENDNKSDAFQVSGAPKYQIHYGSGLLTFTRRVQARSGRLQTNEESSPFPNTYICTVQHYPAPYPRKHLTQVTFSLLLPLGNLPNTSEPMKTILQRSN